MLGWTEGRRSLKVNKNTNQAPESQTVPPHNFSVLCFAPPVSSLPRLYLQITHLYSHLHTRCYFTVNMVLLKSFLKCEINFFYFLLSAYSLKHWPVLFTYQAYPSAMIYIHLNKKHDIPLEIQCLFSITHFNSNEVTFFFLCNRVIFKTIIGSLEKAPKRVNHFKIHATVSKMKDEVLHKFQKCTLKNGVSLSATSCT